MPFFLPRDAMRSLLSPGVRLCVRPSFTLVHGIQTAGDMVKLLSRPGSPIILVFFDPSASTQFQGEPLQQGGKYTGVGKFCDFRLKSPFISETVIGGGSIGVGSDDFQWP